MVRPAVPVRLLLDALLAAQRSGGVVLGAHGVELAWVVQPGQVPALVPRQVPAVPGPGRVPVEGRWDRRPRVLLPVQEGD